jgi:hypothetical protein
MDNNTTVRSSRISASLETEEDQSVHINSPQHIIRYEVVQPGPVRSISMASKKSFQFNQLSSVISQSYDNTPIERRQQQGKIQMNDMMRLLSEREKDPKYRILDALLSPRHLKQYVSGYDQLFGNNLGEWKNKNCLEKVYFLFEKVFELEQKLKEEEKVG